jgi:T5SS/PEP-CTERM-associated repeat protein
MLDPGDYALSSRSRVGFNNFQGTSANTDYQFTLRLTRTIRWIDPVNGSFQDETKWDPHFVPSANLTALFDVPGTYSVQLDGNVTNQSLRAHGAGVNATLDLAGNTYNVGEIILGGQDGDSGTFTFTDSGGIVTAAAAALAPGDRVARAANMVLNPADAKNVTPLLFCGKGYRSIVDAPTLATNVQITDTGLVIVKGNGRLYVTNDVVVGGIPPVDTIPVPRLRIEQGAGFGNMQGVSVVVAPEAGGFAAATIKDPGSFWQTESLVLGKKGNGIQEVRDGATLKSNDIVLGAEAGSNGSLVVKNNGEMSVGHELFVGAAGEGHLDVTSRVTTHHLAIGVGSTGSGEVMVHDNVINPTTTELGVLTVTGFLDVGTLGIGSLLLDGGKLIRQGPDSSTINSRSTVEIRAGQFRESRLLVVDGVLIINPDIGTVSVGPNLLATVGELGVGPGGTLQGNGVIFGNVNAQGGANNFDPGRVFPGFSPGTLTIEGDYEQAGGLLGIEIAGLAPGEFDVLKVTGGVLLGGTLLLDFLGGFAPHQGDQFKFLDVGGTLQGSFANVEVRGLLPGFQFDLRPDAGGMTMVALNDGQAVPEPEGAVLFCIGGLLVARHRSGVGRNRFLRRHS